MDKQTDIKCNGPQAVTDSGTEITAMVTSYIIKEKEKAKRHFNLNCSHKDSKCLRINLSLIALFYDH